MPKRKKSAFKNRGRGRRSPAFHDTHLTGGNWLSAQIQRARRFMTQDRYNDALHLLEKITSNHPDSARAWQLKGRCHAALRRNWAAAVTAFENAARLQPTNAEHFNELGLARSNVGHNLRACADFLAACRVDPQHTTALGNLAGVLNQVGDASGACEVYSELVTRAPEFYSNYLLIMNYIDSVTARQISDAARDWGKNIEEKIEIVNINRTAPISCRAMRVGLLSADFRNHSVMRFLIPLLEHHNPERIKLICYSNLIPESEDEFSEIARNYATIFRRVNNLTDADLAAQIADDEIDLLIDLGGHTANNRLKVMAMRPAPVTATWLGYPNTTGLQSIDFRISDKIVDPEGKFDSLSSEHIWRLDPGFHCFRPHHPSPEVSALPAQHKGIVTFGSFNNLAKVTPKTMDLWAQVLRSVPDSQLVIKSPNLADEDVCARLNADFASRGVDIDRIRYLPALSSTTAHLDAYRNLDIALDTYPYNGTTTTCEALWMGVPLITLCGDLPASRVSASLLKQVGLEPLIAHDAETFALNAVELGSDLDRLAALRAGLRTAMAQSSLCDEIGFAHRFETMGAALYRAQTGQSVDLPADTRNHLPATPRSADLVPDKAASDEIRVLHHLARTGGTLISKCLAAMESVALLSEVHPNGMQLIDPVAQARDWLGLIGPQEAKDLQSKGASFTDIIRVAHTRARDHGKLLVVRDWTHLDYTAVPFRSAPTYRLTTSETLSETFSAVHKTASVRHPIDEWLSLRRLRIMAGRLTVHEYMRGYRRFAEAAAEIGFVRYEDFTAEPDTALRFICDALQVPFDSTYTARWADYDRITGDVSRTGDAKKEIRPQSPKQYSLDIVREFTSSPDFSPAMNLLGYDEIPTTQTLESAIRT